MFNFPSPLPIEVGVFIFCVGGVPRAAPAVPTKVIGTTNVLRRSSPLPHRTSVGIVAYSCCSFC